MFELVDKVSKASSNHQANTNLFSALFYQSKECHNFVQEAFRFEGLTLTVTKAYSEEAVIKAKVDHQLDLLLLDLTETPDVYQEAVKLSGMLPPQSRAIIIGCEDSITVIRKLRELGFYYILWPIQRDEFIHFLYNANSTNDSKDVGIPLRKAKKIRFIGAKGGVGTTLVATELSKIMSQQNLSKCVMVDHNYWGGNIDIMMGISDFQKRNISLSTFGTSIDQTSAHGMLKPTEESLSLLSLTSENKKLTELSDYTKTVVDELASEANFIIEDFPLPVGFQNTHLTDEADSIVIVLSPTVSALRDAGRLKKALIDLNSENPPRIIVVVNYVMPAKFATVTLAEIKGHLGQEVDIVLPHISRINQMILAKNDKKIFNSALGKGIKELAALVLGKQQRRSRFSWFSRR